MAILRAFVLSLLLSGVCFAARLKDIADIEGVRGNQLYGFGIVVGLNGTGDGIQAQFTLKSLSNMLERFGIRVDPLLIQVKNSAAVVVTATLPAFVRPGTKLDVTLSAIGDAKSLQGGTLLFTPLRGADGNVYAVSQGSIAVGGFTAEGGGDSAVKNHPTVGQISEGGIVERGIPFDLFQSKRVRIVLRSPDFTTMTRVVTEINRTLGESVATAIDSASVDIPILPQFGHDPIMLVSRIENVEVVQDVGARVVVNEKTGTIVMGEHVRVSTVALAHGNLSIVVRTENIVSQPNALATGSTAVVQNGDVQVGEEQDRLSIVNAQVSLGEVVKALNALGATPRDLISILSALKRAGALQAELMIM